MKILNIQEALKNKFARQARIKKLQYHASGHCVHIGKLSPGCYACFVPAPFRTNIETGKKCNLSCAYCFTDKSQPDQPALTGKARFIGKSSLAGYDPITISFSGGGEPLLYPGVIREYMEMFSAIEKQTGKRPWYYIYTNGILAESGMLLQLRDMGFDEIRFHLGASNFSAKAYKNMRNAVRLFKAVSVETPAWPAHRKKLFEMMPKIEDAGVKHLNIGEVEVNRANYGKIAKYFPAARIYQFGGMYLYDEGLVYDLIEEALEKGYTYSVLDCSCFVKSIQRDSGKHVACQDVRGLCARYL